MADYDPRLLQPNQDVSTEQPSTPDKKTGCARLGLMGCAAAVLLLGGFFVVLFLGVFAALKASEPYKVAVQRAQNSKVAQQALGTPIEPGKFPSGTLSTANGVKKAELSIPVSGPKANGTLLVLATKRDKEWVFEKLALSLSTAGDEIDLLAEEGPPGKDF